LASIEVSVGGSWKGWRIKLFGIIYAFWDAEGAMKLKTYSGEEIRALRRKLDLNQRDFWAPFQTTQSGGSRYESGREIPEPVQVLLNIAFGTDARALAIFNELRTFGNPKKTTQGAQCEAK